MTDAIDTAEQPAPDTAGRGYTTTVPKRLPAGWVRDDATGVAYVESTGLAPVLMRLSEAGLGLRAGEVRGVSPEVAARMVERKSASLVFPA